VSRLSKNILWNLAGQVLLSGLSFVATKYVFKQLGSEALGVIYFTLTLNLVLTSVLGMGICETTVREVSGHFASEPGYIRDLIRTASLLYWGAYIVLAAAVYGAAPLLVDRWIHLQELGSEMAIRVVRILGIACLVALPRSFYASLLCGLERMEFNNVIDVSASALQQLGIFVILLAGGGLLPVVYWMSACYGFALAAYLLVCARFFSGWAMVPGFLRTVVGRNLSYTSHMALISLLAMVHLQADKVIVSKLLPIGLFGLYTVAYGAVARSSTVTGAIFQGAFPHLSALNNAQQRLGMLSQYRKLQDLVCFVTVPLFTGLIFAEQPLFTLLFNAETARLLLLPVVFLCLGFYMNGALTIPYAFSLAAGRPDISARSNFYALFIVTPATVLLVHFFGLAGAGFSWIFYHLFAYTYAVPRICRACLDGSILGWYCQVLRVVALAGLTYGAAWVLGGLGSNRSLLEIALAYLLASSAFVLGSAFLMGAELRASFRGLFRTFRSKYAEVV
jgi:O-antigen/teichoic acid export membrane protein